MKAKKNKANYDPKKLTAREIPEDIIMQIGQLLHVSLNPKQLALVRNMVISSSKRKWNKKSFLGQALIFHYHKSNLSRQENISYHDLLMAELIRNFSIATETEYLEKCKEFRIYPFRIRKKNTKEPNEKPMSAKDVVKSMENIFSEIEKEAKDEILSELRNALNQEYPICSFENLTGKSRLN